MPRLLYARQECVWYQLNWRFGGRRSRTGRFGNEKSLLPLQIMISINRKRSLWSEAQSNQWLELCLGFSNKNFVLNHNLVHAITISLLCLVNIFPRFLSENTSNELWNCYIHSPGLVRRLRGFWFRQQNKSSQGVYIDWGHSRVPCWDLSPRLWEGRRLLTLTSTL
jgi:hypothetical protein